jgi:flagellar protein FliL
MPTESDPKASPSNAEPAPKKKSRKKSLIFFAAALILVSGAAGAAWMVMQKQADPQTADSGKRKAPSKSIFTPLDSFTVNLQDSGGDHYAQIGVTLEIEDASVESELKARLPALRNNILLLIASKRTDELLSLEGKQLLARQIGIRAAQSIGVGITDADLQPPQATASQAAKPRVQNPIKDVLFSQFLVQ